MTNLEKYDKIFMEILDVDKTELEGLVYRKLPQWDSVGHMDIIVALEEAFDIEIGIVDVIKIASYPKGKDVLRIYGVEI